jgi:hypothetical protein
VKLKNELIYLDKHFERLEFDREIEIQDIYSNIRKFK